MAQMMSYAKPNFLQDMERKNLEFQSKIDRTGIVEETPSFQIQPQTQLQSLVWKIPQNQERNILNFWAPMSWPGITNFSELSKNIPTQSTTQEKSWFDIIPKANANNSDIIKQAVSDISAWMPMSEFDNFYPELFWEKSIFEQYQKDISAWMPQEEAPKYYPELFWENLNSMEKENLPWFDLWVKASQGIANIWKNLKIESWNNLVNSKNPFVSSFWNMIEGFKFAWNIPWDTIQLVWELWEAISNPIWTAKSIKTLWEAVIETWLNKIFWKDIYTSEDKKEMVTAINKALEDNFWSIEAIQKTIIENPTDVLTTITGWLWVAKSWIKNANTIAKINTIQEAINPINILRTEIWAVTWAWKWIVSWVWEVSSQVLWKTTWTSSETIKTAFKQWWTPEFQKALKWDTTPQDILGWVKQWLEEIRVDKNKLYWEWAKILKWNKNEIPLNNLQKDLLDIITNDYKVKVLDDRTLDFSQSKITGNTSKWNIQSMFNDLINWKDKTPDWLDTLKQRIQDYYRGVDDSWKSDRLSTILSNKIKDEIVKKVPEYKSMVQNYEKVTNDLREITKTLSLWKEQQSQTSLTKLNSILRDNFTARQDVVKLIEQYTGKNIQAQVAWASLNPAIAKWLAWVITWWWIVFWQLANPAFWWWLAVASPRLIWEIAKTVWVTYNKMSEFIKNIKKIQPEEQVIKNRTLALPEWKWENTFRWIGLPSKWSIKTPAPWMNKVTTTAWEASPPIIATKKQIALPPWKVITPQTAEKWIIQESKKWVNATVPTTSWPYTPQLNLKQLPPPKNPQWWVLLNRSEKLDKNKILLSQKWLENTKFKNSWRSEASSENIIKNATQEKLNLPLKKQKITSKVENKIESWKKGWSIETLPKDIDIASEAKKVWSKRIAPDRIQHQQLTPEKWIDGIKKEVSTLISKGEDILKSIWERYNEISWNKKTLETYITKRDKLKKLWLWWDNYDSYIKRLEDKLAIKEFLWSDYKNLREAVKKLWNLSDDDITNRYIDLIKKDISKWYKFPEEVMNFDKSFKTALNNRERYEKWLRTSFSADDERIIFDDRVWVWMKRQDGKIIEKEKIDEIVNWINEFKKTTWIDLDKIFKDEKIVVAHLNGKNPFLKNNVAWLYRESWWNKSISVWWTEKIKVKNPETWEMETKNIHTTLSHEFAHWLDHISENKLLDKLARENIRSFNKEKLWTNQVKNYYWTLPEVKARMVEQYVAIKQWLTSIYDRQWYWKKDLFDTMIPEIEKSLKENFWDYKKIIKPDTLNHIENGKIINNLPKILKRVKDEIIKYWENIWDKLPDTAIDKIKQYLWKSNIVRFNIDIVSPKVKSVLKENNIEGVKWHSITSSWIQHILKWHWQLEKIWKNEIPVTINDIKLIPSIIKNPDSVKLSTKKSWEWRKVLIYEKKIWDKYYYLENIDNRSWYLSTQTMYINKE